MTTLPTCRLSAFPSGGLYSELGIRHAWELNGVGYVIETCSASNWRWSTYRWWPLSSLLPRQNDSGFNDIGGIGSWICGRLSLLLGFICACRIGRLVLKWRTAWSALCRCRHWAYSNLWFLEHYTCSLGVGVSVAVCGIVSLSPERSCICAVVHLVSDYTTIVFLEILLTFCKTVFGILLTHWTLDQ